MRINALRKELASLFSLTQPKRTPSLRRSGRSEWLYATDILMLISAAEREQVLAGLTDAGWEYTQENGWILLRKNAPEPPDGWYTGSFGPEAACCASLLDRHAEGRTADAGETQRALIKAGEEGGAAYEAACRALHREWADRLRRKDPLPFVSRRYFEKEKEKETCCLSTSDTRNS